MRIAILLGDARLETLILAEALAQALRLARPLNGASVDVCVGLPVVDDQLWRRGAAWIAHRGGAVQVRRMDWQQVSAGTALRMHEAQRPAVALASLPTLVLPRDWGCNFLDCDGWIVLAAPELGPVYPVRPTAFFCPELTMRRAPFTFALDPRAPYWTNVTATFQLWRQAGVVVTTDTTTAADIVDYAGVPPDRLLMLPGPFGGELPPAAGDVASDPDQLLVRIEPDDLHDFAATTEAICVYQAEGGRLKPVLAMETMIEGIGRRSELPPVVALAEPIRVMLEDLPAVRLVGPERWRRLLARAPRLWSPRTWGDGSHLRWPLAAGCHVLSASHPAARALAAKAPDMVHLYQAGCPDRIADALHALEAAAVSNRAMAGRIGTEVGMGIEATKASLILDRLAELCHG